MPFENALRDFLAALLYFKRTVLGCPYIRLGFRAGKVPQMNVSIGAKALARLLTSLAALQERVKEETQANDGLRDSADVLYRERDRLEGELSAARLTVSDARYELRGYKDRAEVSERTVLQLRQEMRGMIVPPLDLDVLFRQLQEGFVKAFLGESFDFASVSPEKREAMGAHYQRREKIQMIKLIREWSGLGLREAKDLVETLPGFKGSL